MATNYSRGRQLEYRVREELRDAGFTCIRSAGSKGAIDILAGRNGLVLAVQCKRDGELPRHERLRLIASSKDFGAIPVLAVRDKGMRLYLVQQTGKIVTATNILNLTEVLRSWMIG